jgi:hypothetical protein
VDDARQPRLNTGIVASAVRIWTKLGGSAKLRAQPNKRGGSDAARAADIVTEAFLEAQMSKPIRAVVRRQMMKEHRGFALHEVLVRRRKDGMIVVADVQHRPQWTIQRWIRDDQKQPWSAVEQQTLTGTLPPIPRDRLLYSVDDALTDSPAGVGLLRHLVDLARVRDVFSRLEGIGFQTDLGGMPLGRAPLGELRAEALQAGHTDETAIATYILSRLKPLTDLLEAHNKRHDQSLLLDSLPYASKDESQSPSGVFKWSFDVIRSVMSSAPGIANAIARLDREMARVMCAEWLLLGDGSGGTFNMHANKTEMFGASINACLDDVCDDMTRDVAARITALNGLDPETCTPTIEHEPIATQDVESACRALLMIQQAALDPEDEAGNVLRGRMELPPAPKRDPALDAMLRGRGLASEITTDPKKTPDPGEGKPGNVNADPNAGGKTP